MDVELHTSAHRRGLHLIVQHQSETDRTFKPEKASGEQLDLDSNDYDGSVAACGDPDFTLAPCLDATPCDHCNTLPPHLDAIIVAVDGACRDSGTTNVRSSVGVYFAADSQHNISQPLINLFSTSHKAELTACLWALMKVEDIKDRVPGAPLSQVIIKADSEYIVKGMSKWILKWKENGYITSWLRPVINQGLFQAMDQQVQDLNNQGVEVLFWHVPRERNREADALANAAF